MQDQHKMDYDAASLTVIKMIASETHRPLDEVKRVYDDQFTRLKSGARITDYLVLFATRRTYDVLGRSPIDA